MIEEIEDEIEISKRVIEVFSLEILDLIKNLQESLDEDARKNVIENINSLRNRIEFEQENIEISIEELELLEQKNKQMGGEKL